MDERSSHRDLHKEVFAAFGGAYYHGESLHRELCNIYALASYEDKSDMTKLRTQEKLSRAYSMTLGQVFKETKSLFSESLNLRLEEALEKRNYLAHHFWFEQCHLMFSESGLLEMIEELHTMMFFFNKLDEDVADFFKSRKEELGFTEEVFAESLQHILEGDPGHPIHVQRSLKKQERLVKVWNVNLDKNSQVNIFETEDGCCWQLCDAGLGWSEFQERSKSWIINEEIQQYLPSNINPRPQVTAPWHYEFSLKQRAVLWVKRGERSNSYIFGIRENR